MSNSKLYVGNLSFQTSEDALRAHFEQFGSVTDIYVAMDKFTGRPRGFAFVTMGTADEASVAASAAAVAVAVSAAAVVAVAAIAVASVAVATVTKLSSAFGG